MKKVETSAQKSLSEYCVMLIICCPGHAQVPYLVIAKMREKTKPDTEDKESFAEYWDQIVGVAKI